MGYTKQKFGVEARQDLLKGFEIVNSAVSATAGPAGRTVLLQHFSPSGAPKITKDGITVAKRISVPDYVGEGVKMIVQASQKTADEAGDGTTATVILANEIAQEGIKAMSKGCNVTNLKKGINYAVENIISYVNLHSKPVENNEEIKQVALVSANGDEEIADYIAKAVEKIGKDGVITVEEGKSYNSELEVVDGMKIDRGYLSPYFITNPDRSVCEMDNPYVLLYDGKINNLQSILQLLEGALKEGTPLLLVADDVEGEALATLVLNRLRTGMKICAIKCPEFGTTRTKAMEDLAVLLGGNFVSQQAGAKLENVTLANCGRCTKVKIDANHTTFISGFGDKDAIEARCNEIRAEYENSESEYDKEQIKKRLARLSGGVAVLKIGGATEMQIQERKDRVDDAVSAVQAALEDGVVVGGGITLAKAPLNIDTNIIENADERTGYEIMMNSCKSQLIKIADNAGVSGEVVLEKVINSDEFNYGFNAKTMEYGDLVKMGVIDPAKVVKSVVRNASSVATSLLTTEVVMIEDFDTNKERTLPVPVQSGY